MKIPDAIATGLIDGGMETTSKNFETTVAGALHRMKDKDVLRFPDGWDLAEAHSTALRNRLAKETAKPKSKKATKTKGKAAGKKAASAKPPAPKGPKGPSLDERIVAFLAAHPMEWFTPRQVGEALKETRTPLVSMAFARLVRYSKIAKQDDGRYAAVRKG